MSTKAENCPPKKEESKKKSGKEEEEIPKNVHSANNWEGVDLGDDDRKKKFLRLMGAAKKDHHGKIIIGDHDAVHARSRDETVHINEDLEDQFKQGLEHRMAGGFKGHLGLGFHKDDEEKKKEVEEKEEEKKESEGEDKGDNCEMDKPPESTKKEDSETSQESPKKHKMEESKEEEEEEKDESVKKKMKMNFVKASS